MLAAPTPRPLMPYFPPTDLLEDESIDAPDPTSGLLDLSTSLDVSSRQQAHKDRVLSKRILDTLVPYLETTLSISTSVVFPPPHPIVKMSELDAALHELRLARDEEEAASILRDEKDSCQVRSQPTSPVLYPEDPQTLHAVLFPPPTEMTSPDTKPSASDIISPEMTPPTSGHLSRVDSASTETAIVTSTDLMDSTQRPTTICAPSMPTLASMLHKVEDVSRASSLSQIEYEHASQLKIWQW